MSQVMNLHECSSSDQRYSPGAYLHLDDRAIVGAHHSLPLIQRIYGRVIHKGRQVSDHESAGHQHILHDF